MKKILKLFKMHSVSVSGVKGSGKDLLMSNVVARRRCMYISNFDYKCKHSPRIDLVFKKLRVGNTYKDLLDGKVKQYIYPYPDGTDIYISDCGIYFPSQYCNELNRDYKDLPVFLALSRQLGDCRVHTNTQYLGRVWDKIREQSDMYIVCLWARVYGNVVVQKVRIYEKYEAAEQKAIPFRIPMPLLGNSEARLKWKLDKAKYEQTYGKIRERLLVYVNRSKYDTRKFKEILENGKEE